jgi:hypothetical protein
MNSYLENTGEILRCAQNDKLWRLYVMLSEAKHLACTMTSYRIFS